MGQPEVLSGIPSITGIWAMRGILGRAKTAEFALTWVSLAYATRVIRAQTLTACRAPHVEAMRLNGIPERAVLCQGVLPAVLPAAAQIWLVTSAGLLGGTVLVEIVFNYPGIGKVLVTSVSTGDLPVVQALAMLMGALTLLATIAADVVGTAVGRTRSVWVSTHAVS